MDHRRPIPLTDRLHVFAATGFGVGLAAASIFLKIQSLQKYSRSGRWSGAGFFGTVLGLICVLLGLPLSGVTGGCVLAVSTAFAVFTTQKAEPVLGVKDDPRIVADEIVGIFWTFAFLPVSTVSSAPVRAAIWCAGFVLFRVFDVFKWPSDRAQNLPGGWGIVMDDVFSGLLANGILQIVLRGWLLR